MPRRAPSQAPTAAQDATPVRFSQTSARTEFTGARLQAAASRPATASRRQPDDTPAEDSAGAALAGFALAPNHVLDCAVAGGEYRPARDDPKPADAGTLQEIDYGIAQANDFERLARDTADVRAMEDRDLAEIVRIDRRLTGRDRTDYMRHKLSEAMHGSAIRVSLTARLDGAIVGFVMARADLGDFGRTEPLAVIDTIGVDPGYAHRGVGHALLSQLFANLGALRIERVETVVAPRDFGLVGFLYDVGFAPSQRLPFVRRFD